MSENQNPINLTSSLATATTQISDQAVSTSTPSLETPTIDNANARISTPTATATRMTSNEIDLPQFEYGSDQSTLSSRWTK